MSDFKIQEGQFFVRIMPADGKKPVLKASFMIDGVEFEGACWAAKSGKQGSYSGKVKVKGERQEKQTATNPPELEDSIQF